MKRNILRKIIALLITIIVLCSTVFTVNAAVVAKYWNTPISGDYTNLYKLDQDSHDKFMQDYVAEDAEILVELRTKAEEITADDYAKFDELNNKIAHYYENYVGVDVSERLANLTIKTYYFDEKFYGINGLYFSGEEDIKDVLFLNSTLILVDELTTVTYIHEVQHYLGLCDETTDEINYAYEGLAEVVTQNICKAENIQYVDDSAYGELFTVAHTLLDTNTGLLKDLINGKRRYSLTNYMDGHIEGFSNLLELSLEASMMGKNKAKFSIEYLMAEFAKSFGCKANTSFLFGLKTLLFVK